MTTPGLPVGSFVQFTKPELQQVVHALKSAGFRTIGPRIADGSIVFAELDSVEQLPIGYLDHQDGGSYRLEKKGEAWFDYVVGPHSLKNYLFPPRETILQLTRQNEQWQVNSPERSVALPLAVIGPRSCDLHALRIQDRVFLGDQFVDPFYETRRNNLFLVAVNCRRAAATCFCHSMKTGPACTFGFDLALTELHDRFVAEIGSPRGGAITAAADWSPCSQSDIEQARQVSTSLTQSLHARPPRLDCTEGEPPGRSLDTTDIRDLLMDQLQHPRWNEVAERCLSCANCTMVCPTCFCNHVEEVTDLTGDHVRRDRSWASCFTMEHSTMSTGAVRKTTASRYRQWLTHKLATWIDQFGSSGCVGCGRCITWCPVGIDLTEEVAAIRESIR